MDPTNERMIDMNEINIWHVANAGVIIKIGELNIGIDILCEDQITLYSVTPKDIENQVLDPRHCPKLDYVIITHEHEDHYCKHKMIAFLKQQTQAKVISNEKVISELHEEIDETRIVSVVKGKRGDVIIIVKGVNIQVFHSTHMGASFKNIVNVCTMITWKGKKLLIPSDAEPRELLMGDYLRGQKVDFLIVPFPYITLNSVRKLVKDIIQPEQILAIHLPSEDNDQDGYIRQSKEIYQKEKADFPNTTFGEQIGKNYKWFMMNNK